MGLAGVVLNYVKNYDLRMWLKFLYCAAFAIACVVGATFSTFTEAKYIGALFFGYTSQRVWKTDKPTKLLATYWMFI